MTPPPADLTLSPSAGGVSLWIHVTPRARRSAVGGVRGDALRVSVTEPPVGGAANEACARELARALGVRRRAVALDPAARGRRKRVHIEGDSQDLARRLRELAGAERDEREPCRSTSTPVTSAATSSRPSSASPTPP